MGAEKRPDDKIQSEGRKDNAAQHLNAAPDNAGAERYPPTEKDDSIDPQTAGGERRSFEGVESKDSVENPRPRQGAGDGGPDPSVNQGRLGPGGDPAEGKR
jgi:hypothetical protein